MIGVGAIVKVRGVDDVAWFVAEQRPGGQWRVLAKAIDERGRASLIGRTVGAGDLQLVKPPLILTPGTEVTFNGRPAHVVADHGDTVTVSVPAESRELRGGDRLRFPPGNAEVSKASIVRENLK
jgi:hypothetical protein